MRYPNAVAFREVLEGVVGATSGPATLLPPKSARPCRRRAICPATIWHRAVIQRPLEPG
jgi:hypothetical protein